MHLFVYLLISYLSIYIIHEENWLRSRKRGKVESLQGSRSCKNKSQKKKLHTAGKFCSDFPVEVGRVCNYVSISPDVKERCSTLVWLFISRDNSQSVLVQYT